MRAGQLRHRISLVPVTTSTNAASGAITVTDSTGTALTRWASVEPLEGRQLEVARAVIGEVTHQVTVRHVDGIDSSYKIYFGSRRFEVKSAINPDERGIMWRLMCTEQGV